MAETVLGEAERLAHLAAIVAGSDDAIASKDLRGRILTWNPGAQRIFGFTPEEAIGRPMTIIFPPDRLAEEDVILAKIGRGEKVDHYETVRRRKDGTLVDVSVTVSPIRNAQGTIVAASKIARDITERRRLEEHLRTTNEWLKQVDQDRVQFLNMVAHELRTPLTPIMLQLTYLRRGRPDEQQTAEALQLMERNMVRLTSLVEQVLEVSRRETGSLPLHRRDTDLCALADEAVRTFAPIAAEAGVRLTASCPQGVVAPVDPDRIAQVLANLLSNALKFTPRGGTVSMAVEGDADTVRLSVRDDGAGFTAEQGSRLFQPFVQVHQGREGSGLGLYISRSIVRQHGGELVAASPGPGSGASFTVTLPRAGPAAPAPSAPAPPG
jgi:two-component system, chemotaxis family, CheB/CheR fusion protein